MKKNIFTIAATAGALLLTTPVIVLANDANVDAAVQKVREAKEKLNVAQEKVREARQEEDRAEKALKETREKVLDTYESQKKQIMDRLEKEEDKESIGEYVDDAAISAKIKAKMLAKKGLDSLDIKVVTVEGKVTLLGDVDQAEQIGLAEQVAKETKGVRAVDNQLRIKK